MDFFDRDETFEEFQTLFRDQPDLINSIKPEDLPTSFRIKPESTDAEVVSSLGDSLESLEGVKKVALRRGVRAGHPAVGDHAQHSGSASSA